MLFIIGVVIGSVLANVSKELYFDQIEIFGGQYLNKIGALNINYSNLLRFVIWNHYKIFLIAWILSVTVIGILFMAGSILYAGATTGFLVSVAVMQYGWKGVLIFLSYLFPQYFIYIPVALLTTIQCHRLCIRCNFGIPMNRKGKVRLVIEKIPVIILLAVLLLIGCFAETYLNSQMLQKVLTAFVMLI